MQGLIGTIRKRNVDMLTSNKSLMDEKRQYQNKVWIYNSYLAIFVFLTHMNTKDKSIMFRKSYSYCIAPCCQTLDPGKVTGNQNCEKTS